MTVDVLCLRPEADFVRAGVALPASFKVAYRSLDDDDVPALIKQARALVIPAVGAKLSASLFDGTTVKFIQVTGAGLDRLDLPRMQQLGIAVANVSGGSNKAVAEYVVTAASVLLRRLAWADAEIRAGHYRAFRARMVADNLSGLEGLVVGIVGLGVIGVAVAEAFHSRGCSILYYDLAPRNVHAVATRSAKSVSLDQLLRSADLVSLHVPLLPSTEGLLGPRQLDLMKQDAILIQTSRGGVVDETALANCLKAGRLGGAAIDVYSEEPPSPDHPLLALEGEAARRILFTPHIAGVTRQATAFLLRAAWRNVERVLIAGESPVDRVC